MSREPWGDRVGAIVVWLLVVLGTAALIDAVELVPASPSLPSLAGLLALGGLLLLLVEWFVTYFSDQSGRVFA